MEVVEVSNLNFIVGCWEFMKFFKDSSSSIVPRKMKKMSSIKRFQSNRDSSGDSTIGFSRRPMNRLA